MEPNEGSAVPQQSTHHQPPPPSTAATPTTEISSPINGIAPNANNNNDLTFPAAYSVEAAKKKRGRPRKYATPEEAAEARRLALSANPPKKRVSVPIDASASSFAYSSSMKSQLAALGNSGQGFTPHVINVAAGEDVGQKIMFFMQQSKGELCILSASGSISNASLRQPATSGGSITYEGRFDIISLTGSYVRTELGGRSGGLSVCLSSAGGQIVGGGVAGPLTAAGPIQVVVGTFIINQKKDPTAGMRGDASGVLSPSPISGISISGSGFRSTIDFSHQNAGGSPFAVQSRDIHIGTPQPTEWRANNVMHLSPQNGDEDHQD